MYSSVRAETWGEESRSQTPALVSSEVTIVIGALRVQSRHSTRGRWLTLQVDHLPL